MQGFRQLQWITIRKKSAPKHPFPNSRPPFMGMFLKTRGRKIPGASFTATNVRLTNTEKRKLKTPKGPANQLSAPLTRDDSTPVLGFLRICVFVFVVAFVFTYNMYMIYEIAVYNIQ